MQVNEKTCYVIKKMIEKRGVVELPAEGISMYPLIREGDTCLFVSCETPCIKQGEIILFQDSAGKLVTHRFITADFWQKEWMYFFKGDSNLGLDAPVKADKIIGKLIAVKKPKMTLKADSFFLRLWGNVMVRVPFVSGLIHSHLIKKQVKVTAGQQR